MAKFCLAHIGINTANAEEAEKTAKMFELLFGFEVRETNGSYFAGDAVEAIKGSYKGTNGHIAVGTENVAVAQAELESRGFVFDPDTAKYRDDGVLNAIYLKDEICGFAVHLVGKSRK